MKVIKTINWLGVIMMAAGATMGQAGGGDAVEAARLDLAGRLEIPVEQVAVVSEEEVEWPDRGLGCPRKGMNYAQVVTNGSRLVLRSGGRDYAYHSGAGRPYFYCPVPAKKSGAPVAGTPPHDV